MSRGLTEKRVPRASEYRTILSGDIELGYRVSGSGSPVILVHGLAEDGASWDEVAAILSEGHKVHALDFRGHGASQAGQGDGTLGQLADDLNRFIEAVTGPAVLVGFSLGGMIVLEAGLRRPDLASKVMAVGTSSKVGRAAAEFFAARIALLESDPSAFAVALADDTAGQLHHRKELTAGIAAARVKAVGQGAGYINAARAMLGVVQAPLTERLSGIKVPVHIIQGLQDQYCPLRAAEIMREAMPFATYGEIPDAGHLIAADQPELLAAEILKNI